ncbi:MAG: DotI/IcmL family type IV secretion protein [Legionellales bacterium]|nr:DotI/IcmL family type IV secretion protein [Legionellales bacterium]
MMKKILFALVVASLLILTPLWATEQVKPSPANAAPSHINPYATPEYSDAFISQWIKKIAALPFNFDYQNYQQQVTISSSFFTEEAWKQFSPTLIRYGTPEQIQKRRLRVSASTRGTIRILRKGIIQGHFSWAVSLPLSVYFRGFDGSYRHQSLLATIVISRVDPNQTRDGLIIVSYTTTIQSVVKNKTPPTNMLG